MQDTNLFLQLLSSDLMYITTFMCLSYTIGGYINVRGIRYPEFSSLIVSVPWFLVVFAFTTPSLTTTTSLHVVYFITIPLGILVMSSIAIAYIKHKHPVGKYYIESSKHYMLKPLLCLSLMFILRDIAHIPIVVVAVITLLSFTLLLITEIIKEKDKVSQSAFLFNITTLVLFGVCIHTLNDAPLVSIVPMVGGSLFGIFTTVLYSSDKSFKHGTTENDYDLFERFEELVSEGQFHTAVDMSEDGLWEFNLEPDVMTISKPLQQWLGLDSNLIPHAADFWIGRVHKHDWNKLPESWIPEDFSALRNKIRTLHNKNREFEIRLLSADHSYKWVRVRLQVANDGSQTNIHGSFKDIDQAKYAQAQITQLSLYDLTTGLPNFSSLISHLNRVLDNNQKHAILFLNIDNFKIINDLMGFFTGDEILAKISKHLSKILPEHADIFRFGGDEFVILTSHPDQADVIANKIKSEFYTKLNWKETHLRITCSIGICDFPNKHAHDVESILKCADIALEHAKKHGKNKYSVFNQGMTIELEERHTLISALEHSHMRENFEIYYQPLKHKGETENIHTEALLRWTWEGKRISPAKFIPIAEETGLIIPIGKMVLDQVCRDIAYMQARGRKLFTSVNVSAVQLLHPEFLKSVTQAIEAHCIDPYQLTVEITETSLIHDTDSVRGTLEQLKSMGIRISLDDFGTGFSSLSHIIDLPIDELKLDRSFIQNFHMDLKRQNVISNIIQLAHGMGLLVVAEGVEIEAECSLLEKYGCDVCQGYYFAYPMPLRKLIADESQSA